MSDIVNEREAARSWEELADRIEAGDAAGLGLVLDSLTGDEQRFAMSRLSGEEQTSLVELLDATSAAELLEILPEAQAVAILEEI